MFHCLDVPQLFILVLIDIWDLTSFGCMTKLPWAHLVLCLSFGGRMHSFLLGVHLRNKNLGHMVSFGRFC